MIVRSALLEREGLVHGFSTRRGGVSLGPFEALNLGRGVGDDPAAVERNHALLAGRAGLAGFTTVSQVHGDRVVAAAEAVPGCEADALCTVEPGRAVGVKTADCVPILLADLRTGAVAAVHAGWRGTRLRIAARAVEAMCRAFGGRPEDVLAAVGPCIRRCCYEVSGELAGAFASELAPEVVHGRMLDLPLANARILASAGVPAGQLEVLERCTACEPASWFSHRRDGGRTGRHLSFVAPRVGHTRPPGPVGRVS